MVIKECFSFFSGRKYLSHKKLETLKKFIRKTKFNEIRTKEHVVERYLWGTKRYKNVLYSYLVKEILINKDDVVNDKLPFELEMHILRFLYPDPEGISKGS